MGSVQRFWALDGATMVADRAQLIVGASGTETIPDPVYVFQHELGLVLFDTGMDPDAIEDPEGTYGPLAGDIGLTFTADQRIDRQLAAIGFATDDITHVVLSHAHFDHAGGVRLFANAKFYVNEFELSHGYPAGRPAEAYYRHADFEPARAFDWNMVSGDHDLFGDGSIELLHLPGHTPGNAGLLVRLADRNVVLTGDTVHLHDALIGELPFPGDVDTDEAVASIRRIKHIAADNDAEIFVQHDAKDLAALKVIAEQTQ